MSNFGIDIFPDIADKLGLPSPAFIEKDYFAIQLLKLITQVNFANCKLYFSGGTCLSKTHLKIYTECLKILI